MKTHCPKFSSVLHLLVMASLGAVPVCRAADLADLPPNTWVEIKYTTEQPNGNPDEKGSFHPVGWNKIVHDPDGKRVLFYDRWVDRKHGGLTIYGNCLFALDPAAGRLTPITIDNWTVKHTKEGGYRTLALPDNDKEPTPCPRHVYHAFTHAPDLKAVLICNGANQTVLQKDGKLVGHDLCDGAWRLDLETNLWSRIDAPGAPPNRLDDAMAYCPDTKSIVYAGFNRQLWVLDLARKQWRKARQSPPPRVAFGQTIFYDPARKRMLLAGGGALDAWMKGKAPEFRELYAFDPRTEEVRRLADCPTALYAAHLAYDSKRQLFVAAAVFNKGEQPSGMFCYDPNKDAWHEIKPANPIPPHRGWFGWTKLCYDSQHDCFIAMIGDRFYAFRHVKEEKPADSPDAVLAGLRDFYAKTALPDGSFRPGVDPDYAGNSDSGYSDLAPVAYAVVIHKTFGWKLPHEDRTRALLLSRQQEDGAFVNVRGKADPRSPQARLYNTCQGLVALHALGIKPRYDPVPVLDALLAGDYKKFPAYTTSFFPLAYQAAGRRFPTEADRKIRTLLTQADDGYLQDHIAATYHLVHYYRLLGEETPKAEAIVARVLRDQKAEGGWDIKAPDWDVHAAFDALFVLRQLGKGRPEVRRAMDRATRWLLSCRNADGGFGHFPGRRSDADAVYFQTGALVMTGFLRPTDPLPKDPHLYAWGHLFPPPR